MAAATPPSPTLPPPQNTFPFSVQMSESPSPAGRRALANLELVRRTRNERWLADAKWSKTPKTCFHCLEKCPNMLPFNGNLFRRCRQSRPNRLLPTAIDGTRFNPSTFQLLNLSTLILSLGFRLDPAPPPADNSSRCPSFVLPRPQSPPPRKQANSPMISAILIACPLGPLRFLHTTIMSH